MKKAWLVKSYEPLNGECIRHVYGPYYIYHGTEEQLVPKAHIVVSGMVPDVLPQTDGELIRLCEEYMQYKIPRYRGYFANFPPRGLYQIAIRDTEVPLFKAALEYAYGNQTDAALLLGMNQGTFRKKLKKYGLLDYGKLHSNSGSSA